MDAPFRGNAAFLNGTDFGRELLKIGAIQLANEPNDPNLAFAERVSEYVRVRQLTMQNMQELQAIGFWRSLTRRVSWKKRIVETLAGMVWYGKATADKREELSIAA